MPDAILSEVIGAMQTIGFPAVAFYLMYRMADNTIKENTKVLTDIRLVLEKVCTKLDDNHTQNTP